MSLPLTNSDLKELKVSVDFNVAGMAILIYDYAVTFEDEVTWIWGRRWNLTRLIFVVSRYLPFVGMGMTAYSALRSNDEPCGGSWFSVIHTASMVASELLMILRTYSFWHGDKRVLYGLLVYLVATVGGSSAATHLPDNILPGGEPPPGCWFEESRNTIFWYALLALYEIVILALIVYQRFHTYRGQTNSIVRTMYRDGVLYVVSIISISLANAIICLILPIAESNVLDQPQVTLHSVLASRIMFSLRRETRQADVKALGQNFESTSMLPTIAFNDPSMLAESSSASKTQSDIELSWLDGDNWGQAGTAGPTT